MIARRRFLSLAAAFACAPRHASAQQWQGRALGASVSVTLHGPRAEVTAALAAIPGLLEEVEDAFSLYRPTSELVRQPAPATARLVITLTRCARYSARAVQVADHAIGGTDRQASSAPGEKSVRQRRLGLGPAEHALFGGARDRHAHAVGVFRHEDAHQREARGRLLELL
jgi:hypothetical protein